MIKEKIEDVVSDVTGGACRQSMPDDPLDVEEILLRLEDEFDVIFDDSQTPANLDALADAIESQMNLAQSQKAV